MKTSYKQCITFKWIVHSRNTWPSQPVIRKPPVGSPSSPVVVIPGIECDHHLPVPPLAECDAVAVVTILEQRNQHPGQRVRVAEGVGNAVLTPRVDLRDNKDVVEEEHLSLMLACIFDE